MIESEVIVTTKHGRMPTFMAAPDGDEQHPGIILYMDAPGIREELRNMARRIAKHGYFCLLPDLYYRLGHLRFDIPRRNEAMSVVIRGAMNSLMTEVIEDHIRLHVVDPVKDAERARGAEELIEAVQAYLK